MSIEHNRRIDLLANLGTWLTLNDHTWQMAVEKALQKNAWFTQEHIAIATENIRQQLLQKNDLIAWSGKYAATKNPKNVGMVMAGNIPLVGFHDFLCGFISGHRIKIKLSSKDEVLLPFLVGVLGEWEPEVLEQVTFEERLVGCDAYIATGSNNTSRYFEQYFGHVPHIIRKNRTSVAILDGTETTDELRLLADDVYLYYGLGCRNVTQLLVPENYEFQPLLEAFKTHDHYADLNKYKNNYDYHLALYLLNNVKYFSNDSILMVANDLPFSAVGVLHYRYYNNRDLIINEITASENIQAIIGHGFVPFGDSQQPGLSDYADGVDTMAFLCAL